MSENRTYSSVSKQFLGCNRMISIYLYEKNIIIKLFEKKISLSIFLFILVVRFTLMYALSVTVFLNILN